MNGDQEFRERFAALRSEDSRRAPDFERTLRRSSSLPGRLTLSAGLCLLAAALVVIVLPILHRAPPAPPRDAMLPLSNWRAPTDFLLNTSGRELLRTVPRIGAPSGLLRGIPGLDDYPPSRRFDQEPNS
jgi:hypothetical protein